MKQVTLPVGEIAVIAVTRAMLAAGILLLLADRINPKTRRDIGIPLLLIGALSTAPLAIDMMKRMQRASCESCE